MISIKAPNGRMYRVGEIQPDGTMPLDLHDDLHDEHAHGNIPIADLLEHLNTLEGVTVTHEKVLHFEDLENGTVFVYGSEGHEYIKLNESEAWSTFSDRRLRMTGSDLTRQVYIKEGIDS